METGQTLPAKAYLLAYDLPQEKLTEKAWLDYVVQGAALTELAVVTLLRVVFTFVAGSRKPWITSGLVSRSFTGVSAGTRAQSGTKAYCWAISRTVTESSGSTAVPRLLSANSPPRCKVSGSIVSTLLGGCSALLAPVATMTAIMTPSMPSMIATHRSPALL